MIAIKDWKPEIHYVECQCSCSDHVIRFVYSQTIAEPLYEPDLFLEVQLSQFNNVFRRIWIAVKYICGVKNNCGNWGETLIGIEQADQIIKLMEKYKKETEEYNKLKKAVGQIPEVS